MNIYQKKLNKFTNKKIKLYSKFWDGIGQKWSYRTVRIDTRWRHKRDLFDY